MSPVELREILQKTREIVADSMQWAERNFAEDERGKWAPVGSQKAVRFNLAGAMIKSAGSSAREAMQAFAELLCMAPAELDTLSWRHARGLTRPHALELIHWAVERLDGLCGTERSEAHLHFARRQSSGH